MTRILVGTVAATAALGMAWAAGAFITWDIGWMSNISGWGGGARAIFLYVAIVLTVGAGILGSTKA